MKRLIKKIDVFVDTETTGFGHVANPPRDDAIVEIGVAYRQNGSVVRIGFLCNPGTKYYENGRAEQALSVNNIRIDDIIAASSDEIISKAIRVLLDSLGGVVLHSYNIPFDRPFLDRDPWQFSGRYQWGEDVMDVAHAFFDLPSDYKIGLKRSMERLGLKPIGEPHRAVTDAVSAMMVFESIKGITNR